MKLNRNKIKLFYINNFIDDLKYFQTKNKIKVQRDYDLSLPDVIADRDQLIQVILNIRKY